MSYPLHDLTEERYQLAVEAFFKNACMDDDLLFSAFGADACEDVEKEAKELGADLTAYRFGSPEDLDDIAKALGHRLLKRAEAYVQEYSEREA